MHIKILTQDHIQHKGNHYGSTIELSNCQINQVGRLILSTTTRKAGGLDFSDKPERRKNTSALVSLKVVTGCTATGLNKTNQLLPVRTVNHIFTGAFLSKHPITLDIAVLTVPFSARLHDLLSTRNSR